MDNWERNCKFAKSNASVVMEQQRRKYPVGIQTFQRIIEEGYVYVDKTDLVWELSHYATFVFMSRPRRFGKSLLTSTLDSYWRGDKELFKGLKIMNLEQAWKSYTVIHLDLSIVKGRKDADELQRAICWMLSRLDCFERNEDDLNHPIQRAPEIWKDRFGIPKKEYDEREYVRAYEEDALFEVELPFRKELANRVKAIGTEQEVKANE